MNPTCKVSVMVLGEMGVGKTSILQRFTKGKFIAYNASTSINRYFKDIRFPSVTVQLEIYDTGGDIRFRTIIQGNFKKVEGVLLVYDVTDVTSFHKLSSWLSEFRSVNKKAVVLIAGNKCDIPDTKKVSQAMVEGFAAEEHTETYETSAKNAENVKEVFLRLTEKVLEKRNVLNTPTESPASPLPSAYINPSFSMDSEKGSSDANQPESSAHDRNPTNDVRKASEEDAGWCFPDLDYLNARSRNLQGNGPNGDLPPVVPLPEDLVVLHVERCRMDLIQKKQSSCFRCF